MSRSSLLLVALVATLLVAGCSSEGGLTIDDIASGQYTSRQDLLDAMNCESVGMTFHHRWTPDFDDGAALSLAVEHAPALEAEGTVTVVHQVGPDLWAIGDTDGLTIGVVEASGAVAFCHRNG